MNALTFLFRPLKRTLAATAAASCLAGAAHAQEPAPAEAPKHPVKPLLWKVEGPEVKKPAYLFGTIHVGKGPAATLHPVAQKAFDEATMVHTEVPLDTLTQVGSSVLMIRKDGKTLNDSIGPDLAKELDAELKAISPSLSAKTLNGFKTWAVAMTVPVLKIQLGGIEPLDMLLWKKAKEDGKKTRGMQTPAAQMSGFNGFSEEEQVLLLSETLRYMRTDRESGKDSLQALIDVYVSGDLAKVEEEFDKFFQPVPDQAKEVKELNDRLLKAILDDRDVIMADYADAKMKESPDEVHFFAAGAAHFTGESSVRSLLEKKGYKVTRVE